MRFLVHVREKREGTFTVVALSSYDAMQQAKSAVARGRVTLMARWEPSATTVAFVDELPTGGGAE